MKRLIFLLTLASTLSASPLATVTLLSAGNLTNTQGDYISPYLLQVAESGGPTITTDAWCYDFLDSITLGESWLANIDTLAQAAATGRFSGVSGAYQDYELEGILSTFTPTSQAQQIDLQEAMWNIFDPVFPVNSDMTTLLAEATADIPTFNFATVAYLEPVAPGVGQAFVIPVDGNLEIARSPEPATWFMGLVGVGLVGLKRRSGRG